jgi:hypothetical protein
MIMNKEMQEISLLSLNVYKTMLNEIDNNKLVKEIEEYDGSIKEEDIQNKYHTFYEDQRFPFGKSECEKLIDILTKSVEQISNKKMELKEIWTITLKDGQSVQMHTHKRRNHLYPEEHFSVSYYPKAPEGSSDIIFITSACNTLESHYSIPTETGVLLIFNSYLPHMTNRHNNINEERIVISANFSPKEDTDSLKKDPRDWTIHSRKSHYLAT